ncbi:unnamed protein product, partial [Menidia menidia]
YSFSLRLACAGVKATATLQTLGHLGEGEEKGPPTFYHEMGDVRKNSPRAEISSHVPSPACLLKLEKHTADFKDVIKSRKSVSQPRGRMWSAHPCVRPGKRNKASSPCWQKQDLEHSRLFHTSLRQLQAKLEAESQQAQEMIHHLQDTENGLMKCLLISLMFTDPCLIEELELFLRQREEVGLRRRELLHKHWTERVWFPLQKTVEEHASSRSPAEAKRLRNYYSHYLHHCDSKGYIFLETYDPREYNPFLLKKPPYLKWLRLFQARCLTTPYCCNLSSRWKVPSDQLLVL